MANKDDASTCVQSGKEYQNDRSDNSNKGDRRIVEGLGGTDKLKIHKSRKIKEKE